MFNSKDPSSSNSNSVKYDTLISAKTEVVGDITLSGGLHIDGIVKGNLFADPDGGATIRISESGRVDGQVSAPNVIINGIVNGDVFSSEYIELAQKSRVKGDVHYSKMEMVLGAEINGHIHHQEKASLTAGKENPLASLVSEAKAKTENSADQTK